MFKLTLNNLKQKLTLNQFKSWRRHHRILTTTLFFAVLLVPLSSSVNLIGQLGFVQKKISVDTLEGGVIAEIFVVEGQYVEQGDLLMRLDEPRLDAELSSLLNAVAAKRCKLARYEAMLALAPFELSVTYDLIPEAYLKSYCDSESSIAKNLVHNYKMKLDLIKRQVTQAKTDVISLQQSLDRETRRVDIQTKLYQKRQELVDQNFYSESALLEQESLLISAKQNLASKNLELSDKRSRWMDLTRQQIEFESDFFDRNRSDYSAFLPEFESQLASLKTSLRSNKNLSVRASQSGYVNNLKKARPGLLFAPRETMLELVPSVEEFVAVASYKPMDHANIKVGQDAVVRLQTHSQSISPEFKGKVVAISPDVKQASPMDQPTYEAIVAYSCNAACREENHLTAGIPVDVYVLGPRRSLLSYLINSLYRSGATALSEPN